MVKTVLNTTTETVHIKRPEDSTLQLGSDEEVCFCGYEIDEGDEVLGVTSEERLKERLVTDEESLDCKRCANILKNRY